MAININGPTSGQNGTSKARQHEPANEVRKDPVKTGTENASKEDRVELSDRAQVLSDVGNKVSQMPDIDQEKVDRIKSAIENGDYTIDHEKLAAAFRRFESGL